MRHFFILLRHEVHSMLIAPATYVATFLFTLLMGFIYWINLRSYTLAEEFELPNTLFFKTFWLPVFFLVPLLTMRSLAEERRQGTLETLLTTPSGPFSIVFAKFFAAYIFYLLVWILTLAFPFLTQYVAPGAVLEGRLLDEASLVGGISFIALSGVLFIAVGIFSSSLTRSQLVAGMLSFTMLFIIIVGGFLLLNLPLTEQPLLSWLSRPFPTFRPLSTSRISAAGSSTPGPSSITSAPPCFCWGWLSLTWRPEPDPSWDPWIISV